MSNWIRVTHELPIDGSVVDGWSIDAEYHKCRIIDCLYEDGVFKILDLNRSPHMIPVELSHWMPAPGVPIL